MKRARRQQEQTSTRTNKHTDEIKNLNPNPKQRKYLSLINDYTVTIAHGCAGTGKTLFALYLGYRYLNQGLVSKIIYVKPNVEFEGERGRGFLKGDKQEKDSILLGAVKDNLTVFMTAGKAQYLLDKELIEFNLVEDMRGRSCNSAFIIFDEVQNTTKHGVLTVLTRIGQDSKLVLIGDPKQRDTAMPGRDGLSDAVIRLQDCPNVGIIQFDRDDIVRHTILSDILERY